MRNRIISLAIIVMALTLSTNAQVNKTSNFNLQLTQGMGSTVLQNDGITTRLATTCAEILGTYQFTNKLGIGTGISIFNLNGNSFNEIGNYSQTRGLLRIPVLLSSRTSLNEKTHLIAAGGMFLNHVLEDSYQYLNSSETLKSDNLSLGIQAQLGIYYDIRSKLALGMTYNVQNNFANFTKNNAGIDSRMGTNIVGLSVRLKL